MLLSKPDAVRKDTFVVVVGNTTDPEYVMIKPVAGQTYQTCKFMDRARTYDTHKEARGVCDLIRVGHVDPRVKRVA